MRSKNLMKMALVLSLFLYSAAYAGDREGNPNACAHLLSLEGPSDTASALLLLEKIMRFPEAVRKQVTVFHRKGPGPSEWVAVVPVKTKGLAPVEAHWEKVRCEFDKPGSEIRHYRIMPGASEDEWIRVSYEGGLWARFLGAFALCTGGAAGGLFLERYLDWHGFPGGPVGTTLGVLLSVKGAWNLSTLAIETPQEQSLPGYRHVIFDEFSLDQRVASSSHLNTLRILFVHEGPRDTEGDSVSEAKLREYLDLPKESYDVLLHDEVRGVLETGSDGS